MTGAPAEGGTPERTGAGLGAGKRPRALVVYKRTSLERYGENDPTISALLAASDPSVANLQAAHDEHHRSLDLAREAMQKLGVDAVFRHKMDVPGPWDLVVTLGGDGTLLWASHQVGSATPMVSINSAPGSSVGYFSAGDGKDAEAVIEAALSKSLSSTRLTRMAVRVDGELISSRILNDVLFCHKVPAAASRFLIRLAGQSTAADAGLGAPTENLEEEHVSSGLWAGPAAGSTAAQRSAGGRVLPIGSKKLQWVVREPYRPGDVRLLLVKGFVRSGQKLCIVSKIRDGRLYLDGAQRVVEVDIGGRVELTQSGEPLTILGLRSRGR